MSAIRLPAAESWNEILHALAHLRGEKNISLRLYEQEGNTDRGARVQAGGIFVCDESNMACLLACVGDRSPTFILKILAPIPVPVDWRENKGG